ncbi:MAG: hypothetical protein DCC68_24770 [Planctomycetota bacterium]|nr:MAG: hypothetical protein DCC68_24770 [Planctomycetota bacterium]
MPIHAEPGQADLIDALKKRSERLMGLRAIDFACGSGAFLASGYRHIVQEFWRIQASLAALQAKTKRAEFDLLSAADVVAQARELPRCIYGVDILPQAVEIAKLTIWLRSARKDEKVLDLSANIIAADSLALPDIYAQIGQRAASFDLVVGNPPWGGSRTK